MKETICRQTKSCEFKALARRRRSTTGLPILFEHVLRVSKLSKYQSRGHRRLRSCSWRKNRISRALLDLHPQFASQGNYALNSMFYKRQIPSIVSDSKSFSTIDATRRLLENALLDLSNERFVLLSPTCILLFNFVCSTAGGEESGMLHQLKQSKKAI
ncbi:hypothetical protein C4D60_Mb09t13350 [Musa balbisiana]|uniref:Uncharacterized protein n=1 Tax=Musa balbisiana TaxID=52838 RepID=A0A4S8IG74_MUSBA|nr:hypothetical protein C4D60_Mb09t13350 [Musa balbisiana]